MLIGTSLRGSERFSAVTTMVSSVSRSEAGGAVVSAVAACAAQGAAIPNAASTANFTVAFMFTPKFFCSSPVSSIARVVPVLCGRDLPLLSWLGQYDPG
jgi:hypothetical protein